MSSHRVGFWGSVLEKGSRLKTLTSTMLTLPIPSMLLTILHTGFRLGLGAIYLWIGLGLSIKALLWLIILGVVLWLITSLVEDWSASSEPSH